MAASTLAASSRYSCPFSRSSMKSRFHFETRCMEAYPPLLNARSKFSVEHDWSYALIRRAGSGLRASGVNSHELMLSPR